jgi:acetyl esterase/lipase
MLTLRDRGEALPDAAALFSPSTDMVGDAASLMLNTPKDAMFHGAEFEHLAAAYLRGADRAQPLASPLRADLTGGPPLMIHVGHDEVPRDDSLRLATKAQQAGGQARDQGAQRRQGRVGRGAHAAQRHGQGSRCAHAGAVRALAEVRAALDHLDAMTRTAGPVVADAATVAGSIGDR